MREDWIECKLADISHKITDGSHNPPPKNNSGGMMMLSARNIFDNKIDYENVRHISKEDFEIENRRTKVEVGDVLLTIVATIGRSAVVRENDRQFVLQRSVAVIGAYINSNFLNYYFQSQSSQSFLWSNAKGTAQKGIYLKVLSTLPVIVPPIPEQRAIVKKLESLFSSLYAGVADLKRSQQQLKIYRQAVLKKAFEGDFTKEEIEYKTIGEIGKVKGGKRLPKGHNYVEHSPYPYLRVTDFNNLTIDTSSLKYISKETHQLISRYTISKDDVFISIAGTIGQVGIIPDHLENANLTENAAKITELKDVNNKYLAYYLSSSLAKNQITEKTMATTQPKLALFRIEKIIFPYYSIIKQHQIVKQIESRLSVCDSIEQNIKESLEKADALRQSILKKAFEGNLLTAKELAECKMAEDYEPASVLLERIKADQNKATTKPSKKKVATPLVVAKQEKPIVKVSADIHAGLIAKVVKLHEESPASLDKLSHIKCEKIAHLVEYHLQIPLGRQPVKDAAGPDDYPHLKIVESRAKKAGFFNKVEKPIGYSYRLANNSDRVIEKFQSALSVEKNKKLDDLIALFLKFDLEVSEIIATTYAGWNNLILNGNANPSDEEIVYESRENWSERKLKIARERFFKAIEWMRKNEIVPTGYGAIVPFPKKKK